MNLLSIYHLYCYTGREICFLQAGDSRISRAITVSESTFFIMGWKRVRPLASTQHVQKNWHAKVCVCVSGPFSLLFLSRDFDHEGVNLEQPFLVCRLMTNSTCEKLSAWPTLSVRLSFKFIRPKPPVFFDHEPFHLGQRFLMCWFMGNPQGKKWTVLLPLSVRLSLSYSHKNLQELLTMIEFT